MEVPIHTSADFRKTQRREDLRRHSEAAVATIWLVFYVLGLTVALPSRIASREIELAAQWVQADEDTPGHLFSRAVRRAKLHACRQALRRGPAIADAGHPAAGAGNRRTIVPKKQFKRAPD